MGFTEMEAIVAATKHGSELLRMEHLCGTVEEGKRGDLIVVNGNPLDDIAILQDRTKLDLVMKDGKVYVNHFGLPAGAAGDSRLRHGHREDPERQGRPSHDAHRCRGSARPVIRRGRISGPGSRRS